MNRKLLDLSFKSDTPVLPAVKIVDAWGYYDGPLFGVCEVRGQEFFFMDVIYDVWRHYDDKSYQRLWSIFSVYDISIAQAEKIADQGKDRQGWESEIEEESDCIGIFWTYERAGEFKRWSEQ